jgi:hypothetical protein
VWVQCTHQGGRNYVSGKVLRWHDCVMLMVVVVLLLLLLLSFGAAGMIS